MLFSLRAYAMATLIAAGAILGGAPSHGQGPQIANLAAIGRLEYDVLRDGDKIGDHSFAFERSGNALDVVIDTDVRVKLAFITLYRFWHHGTERWVDGRLAALASKTDDDGTSHEMKVERLGDSLSVIADKSASVRALDAIPASLWHPGILKVSETLNTIDGTMMAISTAFVGEEQLRGPKGPMVARHYSITGDLQRDLWFDAQGTLVRARFKGQDGSDIQYVLR